MLRKNRRVAKDSKMNKELVVSTESTEFVTDIRDRITGCIAIRVDNSNGNGDINDGSPRTFPDGHGWISSQCAKRQHRNLLDDHDNPSFEDILSLTSMSGDNLHIFESIHRGFKGLSPKDARDAALALSDDEKLSRYIDIRWFGTTCLQEKGVELKKGEVIRFIRTGCIQIDPLVSVAPVEVVVDGLSRKSPLRDTSKDNKGENVKDANPDLWQSDFGPEAIKFVRHGLYFGCFHISPKDAVKTKTTMADIELFLNLVPYMFLNKAAQRTNVEVVMAVAATHEGALGSFPNHVFRQICCPIANKAEPASLQDYAIPSLEDIQTKMSEYRVKEIRDLLAGQKVRKIAV